MIIDCIADLHGFYPELEGGDLLIVAGDLTKRDQLVEYMRFIEWLHEQEYKKMIYIAGNHDNLLVHRDPILESYQNHIHDHIRYLCDSGTEFEGLKIWGSPWTLSFPGINPHCTAFTGDEELLKSKFDLIPDDVDILITHGPPYGILDKTERGENVGSRELMKKIGCMAEVEDKNRLLICGHIHERYGQVSLSMPMLDRCSWKIINCSHVNEHYEPVNKSVRIIL